MRLTTFAILAGSFMLSSCYSYQWNASSSSMTEAPEAIVKIFESHGGTIHLDAQSPGKDYCYDIGEKDLYYGKSDVYRFDKISLTLCDKTPEGQVLADFSFEDDKGNKVLIPAVDLLRITPKIDSKGDLIYPELILEEFNRFGVNFREEHNEFTFISADAGDNPAYRANLTNNCLSPGKWEFALTSADFSDFSERYKSDINLNQNKILSHTWFYLDQDLYNTLMAVKNPGVDLPQSYEYNELSQKAEKVVVDFETLRRPIKNKMDIEVLEIGHQTNRVIEPLDREQHYKKQFGLILNNQEMTYQTILEQPLNLTKFQDRGYYTTKNPNVFDYSWMKFLDDVTFETIDVKGSDAYTQITLSGEWSPYNITIGNVDLALINEQKLYGMLFGINTYPKSRRYNPKQTTIAYDAQLLPEDRQPYVLLTDKKTGTWVNNQYKGVEKIYLTYESMEKDVIDVYVLSYERITPVWMARIKLPREIREMVRIRKKLYSY